MEQKDTIDNRYSHSKIYKLIDNATGMFYIGSTAMKRLDHRYNSHRDNSINDKKKARYLYQYFTHDKFINREIKIIQLAEINVKNKRELEKIENDYIQKEISNVLCLNTNKSFLSPEDKIIRNFKYQEKYREQNKEILKEKAKERRELNHDYYLQYDRDRLKNQERREYNIRKCKEFRSNIYKCVCGSSFKMDSKTKHFKSNKHLEYIEQQQETEGT